VRLRARRRSPSAADRRFERNKETNMKRALVLGVAAGLTGLTFTASAFAHAEVSPKVAVAKELQLFTLAVPTEKENATTTTVELTPPKGFAIDSFVPAPGWKRTVQKSGKVTWTGGSVPTGEDASFSFLASTGGAGNYTFGVKQTYSDGSVVAWSGPESSDSPAPVVRAVSSLGGGGTSTLTWVALALGAVGVVLAAISLLARTGRELS
jgi:uncharacterized protein YcnI